MGVPTDGSFTFHSSDPLTNQLLAAAVDVLFAAIINPPDLTLPIALLPQFNYNFMNDWLRCRSLPTRLSKEALEMVNNLLPLEDNWQDLLDLAPKLPNREDRVCLVGVVAYIEVWLRFNPPPSVVSVASINGD